MTGVLERLVDVGEGGATTLQIAEGLGLTPTAALHELRGLNDDGLVIRLDANRWIATRRGRRVDVDRRFTAHAQNDQPSPLLGGPTADPGGGSAQGAGRSTSPGTEPPEGPPGDPHRSTA